jgi:hypothetical protein
LEHFISHKLDSAAIDRFGFGSLFFDQREVEVYTFGHLMDDFFTLFNNTGEALFTECTNESVEFDKSYAYLNRMFRTQQRVSFCKDVIWQISVQRDYQLTDWAFGLTCKIGKAPLSTSDGETRGIVIDYSAKWVPFFSGHVHIDIPIVTVTCENGRRFAVSLPPSQDAQFYTFKDGETKYLKVEFRSSYSERADVMFSSVPDDVDLREFYKTLYPESTQQVDFWNTVLKKMSKHYGVTVYHNEITSDRFLGRQPSLSQVTRFCDLLWDEMRPYPKDIFRHIGINRLYLCQNLSSQGVPALGVALNEYIILNIGDDVQESDQRLSLHHEVFHAMRHRYPDEIQDIDRKIDIGHLSFFKGEDLLAEMFAYLMTDSEFMHSAASLSTQLDEVLSDIKAFLNKHFASIDLSSQSRLLERSYRRDYKNLKAFLKKNQVVPKPPQFHHLVVIGLDRASLSVFENCFRGEYETTLFDDIEDLSQFKSQMENDEKSLVYITRSPLDFAAIRYYDQKAEVKDSMAAWIRTHQQLIETKSVFVRLEDILTDNTKVLNMFCSMTHLDFKIDYSKLDSYDIRSYNLATVPFLERIWVAVRHSQEVQMMRYSDLTCED